MERLVKSETGTLKEYRHYIQAGGQTIAVHTRWSNNNTRDEYLHHDHLGSVVAITNSGAAASIEARKLPSINLQTGAVAILEEGFDPVPVPDQHAQHIPFGPVAALEPDDLRRIAVDQAELVEIRVLGHDGKAVVRSVAPDGEIVGLVEINELDLC